MGKSMHLFHVCWGSDKDPRQETSLHTKPFSTHPTFQCSPWEVASFHCRWRWGCFRLFLSSFLLSSGWEVASLGRVGQLHHHMWRWDPTTWPGVLRALLRRRVLPGTQGRVQAVQWQEVSWYVPQTPHTLLHTGGTGILEKGTEPCVRELNATRSCDHIWPCSLPRHKILAEASVTMLISVDVW